VETVNLEDVGQQIEIGDDVYTEITMNDANGASGAASMCWYSE
jgi:hypothetical protein